MKETRVITIVIEQQLVDGYAHDNNDILNLYADAIASQLRPELCGKIKAVSVASNRAGESPANWAPE